MLSCRSDRKQASRERRFYYMGEGDWSDTGAEQSRRKTSDKPDRPDTGAAHRNRRASEKQEASDTSAVHSRRRAPNDKQEAYIRLVHKWGIRDVTEIRSIYYSGQVFLVKTAEGGRYILKEKKEPGRIRPECLLLTELKRMKIPVPAPVTGKNGEFFFEADGKLFCLYPFLSGGVTQHYYTEGGEERARAYGRAIAVLHTGMKACDDIPGFAELDALHEVRDNALPAIIRNSTSADTELAVRAAKSLISGWEKIKTGLAAQLIHMDLHPANMLFDKENRLLGIISFDSAARGPRIFDPCYCLACMLINGFEEPEKKRSWFKLAKSLVNGYESTGRLTDAEKSAVVLGMMLAIFILDEAFFGVNNKRMGERTLKVLQWVCDNREEISQKVFI
jgi:Ser/Thr protein kinase RdoA (MazF antagonist)